MVDFMFANFLQDADQYAQAERLWNTKWQDLLRRLGQQQLWSSPWLNTRFADGTPFADGNPIFSAVCPSRQSGLRVIQLDPAEDADELTFWFSTFSKGEPEETKELVISCVLTTENLTRTLELMKQWVTRQSIRLSRVDYPSLTASPIPAAPNRRQLVPC